MNQTRQSHANPKLLVIHAAWGPKTGVLSLITNLVRWQMRQDELAVRLALFECDKAHLNHLRRVVEEHRLPGRVFGCLRTPLQRLVALLDPRLQRYIDQEVSATGASRVVIHFHNSHFSAGFLPLKAPRGVELRHLVTFHGCPSGLLHRHPLKMLIHRFLTRRLARYPVRRVSVSRTEIPILAKAMGYPEDTFVVVHNGALPTRASQSARYPESGRLKVGFVGCFDDNKRWWLAAEGVELAQRRGVACEIVLVGAGAEAEAAKRWAADRTGYATFLGEVPDAANDVIPGLDLLVLTSQREGIPMVILEAFASGVPVIATAVGGIPELVKPGCNGYLIEPSPDAIAERIAEMCCNPRLLSAMRDGARASYHERLSMEACGGSYAAQYLQLFHDGLAGAESSAWIIRVE